MSTLSIDTRFNTNDKSFFKKAEFIKQNSKQYIFTVQSFSHSMRILFFTCRSCWLWAQDHLHSSNNTSGFNIKTTTTTTKSLYIISRDPSLLFLPIISSVTTDNAQCTASFFSQSKPGGGDIVWEPSPTTEILVG